VEEYLVHFAEFIGKDRRLVFSEENSRHPVGRQILRRCRGDTVGIPERLKAQDR
jgi:hypothetical protein